MTLGFSTHYPKKFGIASLAGEPTGFEQKVLNFEKIHTFRFGSRWKKGNLLHMCVNVRTVKQRQFNRGIAKLSHATRVQQFRLRYIERTQVLTLYVGSYKIHYDCQKQEVLNEPDVARRIAECDGLPSAAALFEWLLPEAKKADGPYSDGQVIHFGDTWYH